MRLIISLVVLAIITGCTGSIVESKKSNTNAEGIRYYLPKQFVTVKVERSKVDFTKKKAELKSKIQKYDATIAKLKSEIKELENFIAHLTGGAEEEVKKESLKSLAIKQTELIIVGSARLKDLTALVDIGTKKGEHIVTNMSIKPGKVVPDMSYPLVAQVKHKGQYSDKFSVKVVNGLLSGDGNAESTDQTGQIFLSLVETAARAISATKEAALFEPEKQDEPEKPTFELVEVLDPDDPNKNKFDNFNRKLRKISNDPSLTLSISPLRGEDLTTVASGDSGEGGLYYRTPGMYKFELSYSADLLKAVQYVSLAQGGHIGRVDLQQGFMAQNKFNFSFKDGQLVSYDSDQPSEVLATVRLLPEALKTAVSVPAEMIQLKVNHTTAGKELLEAQKAKLEAQKALEDLIKAQNHQ